MPTSSEGRSLVFTQRVINNKVFRQQQQMNYNLILHSVAVSECLHDRENLLVFLPSTADLNVTCKIKPKVKFVNIFPLVLSLRMYNRNHSFRA